MSGSEYVGVFIGAFLGGIVAPAAVAWFLWAAFRPLGTKARFGLWRKGGKR